MATMAMRPKWVGVYDTPYSNQYNTVANAFFLGLMSISLAGCVLISWKTRRCVLFSFVLCVAFVMEIISYALRFQGWSLSTFTTTVGLSTIAPVFVTIGIHICSAQVVTTLGPEHAPFSPNAHLRIFIWTDLLAALLQGVGLGLVFAGAVSAGLWGVTLPRLAPAGQSVLFTGLFFQCLGLAGALVCLTTTYVRAGRADRRYGTYATFHQQQHHHHHGAGAGAGYVPLTPRAKTFLAVLPLAGVCVLVRCAYRAAAAWGGLVGPVARDPVLWLVAEGVLLTEAMVTLAVFHPAVWLDDEGTRTGGGGAATARGRHHDDVEDGEAGGAGGAKRPGHLSVFSMGSSSIGAAYKKRFSSATSLGDVLEQEQMQMPMQEHGHGHGHGHGYGQQGPQQEPPHPRDSRASHLNEASQLLFQTHLIAPSDAGSSSCATGSRRGSAGSSSSQPDPYLPHQHDRRVLYDDPADASPYADGTGRMRGGGGGMMRYSEDDEEEEQDITAITNYRYEHDIDMYVSPETRDLSPLEAEAEADRISIAPEVPRKSSKRMSRLTPPGGADITHQALSSSSSSPSSSSNNADEDDDDDRLEVESVVLPLRKPSRREDTMATTTTDEAMEEVALRSTYSTSLYSQ